MEILKCKVQDPGFPDTEVTCLKTDDGQTYFFIEDGTLKNGNVISTPILKEGIGHAPYTSLGLITPQGEVLIPFENKNIKPLSNDLLLVERNTPVTESVVEALGKQNDPLSASELIETANTIKEQMKSIMGTNGAYAFDNQFSEAALYTTAGVNLANDYFSFIGASDGVYYMSKNIVGSPISKYDPYTVVNQEQATAGSEEPVQENNQNIENSEVPTVENNETNPEDSVTPPSIDIPIVNEETNSTTDPMLPEVNMGEVQNEPINEDNTQVEVPSVNETVDNQAVGETVEQPQLNIANEENSSTTGPMLPEVNMNETQNEVTNEENAQIEIPSVDATSDNQEITETQSELNIAKEENEVFENNGEFEKPELNISEDTSDEIPQEENDEIDEQEEYTEETSVEDYSTEDIEDSTSEVIEEYDNETNEDNYETSEEISDEENEYQSFETSEDEGGFDNTTESEQEYVEEESDDYFEEEINNPIIANATNTIRKLLEENRNQRQIIDKQESEIEALNASNEILSEENTSKTKEIIALRNSNAKYRSDNNDLNRENGRLKATTQRQEEVIEHLKSQNSALKEQVAGITALSNVVAEANNLFAPAEETSSYGSEYGYLDEDTDSYQYTKKAA